MINHRSQKINPRHQAVMGFSNKHIKPMWPINSNLPFRPNNASTQSEILNKAKKLLKAVCMYCLMFLESSSIHGLNHLIAKKRATSER